MEDRELNKILKAVNTCAKPEPLPEEPRREDFMWGEKGFVKRLTPLDTGVTNGIIILIMVMKSGRATMSCPFTPGNTMGAPEP